MSEYKSLLKNLHFLQLWGSQILSQLTIQIMNFLLLFLLFNRTGSSIATSMLWVTIAIPAIMIGPFSAASTDMFNRRKMLMLTNILQAATVFIYSLIYQTSLFLLFGIVFIYSFLNQFYVPAEAASLPSLVDKKELPHANSLFFLTQEAAIIVGFGSAGILSQLIGFENTLALCSIFLVLAFVCVSFLPEMKAERKIKRNIEDVMNSFFTNITEGYKYIKSNHVILAPFILLLVFQAALAIILVNVPLIAQDILGIGISSISSRMILPAAIGAITSAIAVPKLLKMGWRKKRVIELALITLVICVFMMVFIIPELNQFARIMFGVVTVFVSALSFVGILIPSQTLIQEITPGGLRGRVFGNFWFLSTIITVFPVIFSGTISELFGIRVLLLFLGATVFGLLMLSKNSADKFLMNGFKFYKNV